MKVLLRRKQFWTILERFKEAIQFTGFNTYELLMGNLHNMKFRYYDLVIQQHFQKCITAHTNKAEVVLKWLSSLQGPVKYMSSLLGYVQNNQLIGPFAELPPPAPLLLLIEYAYIVTEKRPPMNPSHSRTDEFMKNMPHPEEGAVLSVSMTGDLQEIPRKTTDPECHNACGNQIA